MRVLTLSFNRLIVGREVGAWQKGGAMQKWLNQQRMDRVESQALVIESGSRGGSGLSLEGKNRVGGREGGR